MENNNDKNQQKPTNLIDSQTGLNAKQIEAATLIVAGETITSIADKLNINRSTIYEWLEKVTFQCYINRLLKDIVCKLNNELCSMGIEAIKALKEVLQSKNDMIKLKAAQFIIENLTNKEIEESNPKKIFTKQCTTIPDVQWGEVFNERQYENLLKENGLK